MTTQTVQKLNAPGKAVAAWLWPVLRTAVFVVLAAAASWSLLRVTLFTSSTQAIVFPKVVNYRAPINGFVSYNQPAGEGARLSGTFASIDDPFVDDTEARKLAAEVAASTKQRAFLNDSIGELNQNLGRYRATQGAFARARMQQLEALFSDANEGAPSARTRADQSTRSLERVRQLAAQGLDSQAGLEEAERNASLASQEVNRAEQRLQAARAAVAAARNGIDVGMLETTPMPAHAQTQVDQTGLKLIDLMVRRSETSASFDMLSERANSEKQRVAMLRHQELRAPLANRVARRMAANGEFVTRGANLLQVFDCSEITVVALLGERPFGRLRTGAPARLKLTESSEIFEGHVAQLLGPIDEDPMAFPHISERFVSKAADYRAVLRFPELARRLGDGCEAGLPAEVSFPGQVWRPSW